MLNRRGARPGCGTCASSGTPTAMRALLPLILLSAMLVARAQGDTPTVPAAAPAPVRDIVQQRLPDGRVIFTDRPVRDARTLRTWQYQPEDPQLATARRAAAERESAAVTERIARRLEQQREIDRDIELARAQAAAAAAERDAARVRSEAEQPQVIVWPRRSFGPRPPFKPHPPGAHLPFKPHPPGVKPPQRPGPKLPPRPGATPPPGPNTHYDRWPP